MPHMKLVEGKSVEWAIAKWKEIKDNADIPKAGEGDDLEVPWRGIRSTEGVRGREISRAIQNSAELENEEAAQAAVRRLASLGSQSSLSQAEFGGFGDVFRSGAAGSSGNLDAAMRNFGVGNDLMSIPQPSLIIPTSAFDRPVPRPIEGEPSRAKRSLAQSLSDPPEPGAKRFRNTEKQGACGEVVSKRKQALKCCADCVNNCVVAREN